MAHLQWSKYQDLNFRYSAGLISVHRGFLVKLWGLFFSAGNSSFPVWILISFPSSICWLLIGSQHSIFCFQSWADGESLKAEKNIWTDGSCEAAATGLLFTSLTRNWWSLLPKVLIAFSPKYEFDIKNVFRVQCHNCEDQIFFFNFQTFVSCPRGFLMS